jgi:hypothetical protein
LQFGVNTKKALMLHQNQTAQNGAIAIPLPYKLNYGLGQTLRSFLLSGILLLMLLLLKYLMVLGCLGLKSSSWCRF